MTTARTKKKFIERDSRAWSFGPVANVTDATGHAHKGTGAGGGQFTSGGGGGGTGSTSGSTSTDTKSNTKPAATKTNTPAQDKGTATDKLGVSHSPSPAVPDKLDISFQSKPHLPGSSGSGPAGSEHETVVRNLIKKTFGKDVDPAKLAAAANAQPGAKVSIGLTSAGGMVEVNLLNPNGSEARRTFYQDHTGSLVVSNDAFNNKNKTAGGPSGAQALLDQVRHLRDLGVKKIVTQAEGSKGDPAKYVGYTVWPKLGYDGAMSDEQFGKLPKDIQTAMGAKKGGLFGLGKQKGDRSILTLHQTPGGAEAWAEHGSTFAGTFDLSDGSRNMKHLDQYAGKKGLK